MSDTTSENSSVMHGTVGDGGMFTSQARTLATELYDPARVFALNSGHDTDIETIDREQAQFANLLHKNFNQVESKALVVLLQEYARPMTEVRTDESLRASEIAGAQRLQARHGMAGSKQLQDDANIAIGKLTKAAPTLRRILIENGARHNPYVIEHLAGMTRSGGWK